MNAYQVTLLVVGVTGLLAFFVFWSFLVHSDRSGRLHSNRTRGALKVAALAGIVFFFCIVLTVTLQSRESWLQQVRFLPWIISGAPIALILGYIARRQAETLFYVAEHPRLRVFLSAVTYILLLDWLLTTLIGLSFSLMPDTMPEIPTGSLIAVLERIPLLATEILCLTAVGAAFWKSGGPLTPSHVLRIRNRLFFAGTACWILVEIVEMSFPLADYFLDAQSAASANAALTLTQALIIFGSIAFWLAGFIKHRSRTELDVWRERFLEWSRLREMLGVARAKIRFQSNGLLMTHEYHLTASAKCLGLSEDDRRKALLTLHMVCVLAEATSYHPLSKCRFGVRRADLLKCATLQDYLLRSKTVSTTFELHLTTGNNDRTSYGLGNDLLYEVMRPTLWITESPLQTDIARCPLWVQLASVSAAHAGLLSFHSQCKILTSRRLHTDLLSTYELSMELSARERIR